MTPSTDIAGFLRTLQHEGVREIRIPECPDKLGGTFTGTASGYFDADHLAEAAEAAERWGRVNPPGIYVTLNPCNPDLLARAVNRVRHKTRQTTSDKDILSRRWLMLDVDPVRPSGISANEAEVAAASEVANDIAITRAADGWPAPLRVFSGNGEYLLYRVELPNDAPATALLKAVTEAIGRRHDTDRAGVDRATFNAARILKVAGTWARKGDSTADRPHRQSWWVPPAEPLGIVTVAQLEALADTTITAEPPRAASSPEPSHGEYARFEHTVEGVATYLQSHGVELSDVRPGRITLARCPITGADGGTSVAVLVSAEGRIAYSNLHHRGVGLQWVDLRNHLEPGYKAFAASRGEHQPDAGGVDLSGFLCGPPPTPTTTAAAVEFPVHLLEVPGFVAEVMAYNLATAPRPQPVLALAGALALQSVLAARKVRDERGNRTNLYMVGVADSGAGKEHARQVNKRILASVDGGSVLEAPEDIASDAGLVAAVKAQHALLFQIDEFGRFLRSSGDPRAAPHLYAALGALMRLYSAAGSNFRGKAYADAEKNVVIVEPCVSLYGTSVPSNFFGSLTAEGMEDGFVARMMAFIGADAPQRQRVPFGDPPPSVVAGAAWWVKYRPPGAGNMHGLNAQPLVVQSTPDALALFDSIAEHVEAERIKATPAAKSLWARAEEKACRLALTYACSANTMGTPIVDVAAAAWACELSEWLTRQMVELADQYVHEGLFDGRQKKVLRAIRAAGGEMTASELCIATRNLTPRERLEVVANLVGTGQIIETTAPTGETGGRPRKTYRAQKTP